MPPLRARGDGATGEVRERVRDDLIICCQCGCEYLHIADLSDDDIEDYALSITAWPHTLGERLRTAWQALRGRKFWYSEVCLGAEEMRRLREWLAE